MILIVIEDEVRVIFVIDARVFKFLSDTTVVGPQTEDILELVFSNSDESMTRRSVTDPHKLFKWLNCWFLSSFFLRKFIIFVAAFQILQAYTFSDITSTERIASLMVSNYLSFLHTQGLLVEVLIMELSIKLYHLSRLCSIFWDIKTTLIFLHGRIG